MSSYSLPLPPSTPADSRSASTPIRPKIETASGSVACLVSLTNLDQSLTNSSSSLPCSNFPGLSSPRGLHQILPALFTIRIPECTSPLSPYAQREQIQLLFAICATAVDLLVCISLRARVSVVSAFVSLESTGTIPPRCITCHRVVPQRRSPHSLESSLLPRSDRLRARCAYGIRAPCRHANFSRP